MIKYDIKTILSLLFLRFLKISKEYLLKNFDKLEYVFMS